ncbi:MAG: hypothetical protein O3C40_33115 [Planctomycetota bacterium]|nr:hypothetical protein [Planctomycetota bacterium]
MTARYSKRFQSGVRASLAAAGDLVRMLEKPGTGVIVLQFLIDY